MAQPGDDQKGNEGDDVKQNIQFGDYKCVFRAAQDSLYIMMKNSKTKIKFENTFTESTLVEMDLKQSIDKVVNLLLDAQSGDQKELSFKIGFGDAESQTKGSNKSQQQPDPKEQISFDQLSKSYLKGSALYIFVNIDNNWINAEYVFKLLEQERNELDILRDIIADQQEEIEQLKKVHKPGIASWYHQGGGGTAGNLTMTGVLIAPSIDGMVALSQNRQEIIVGIAGLYKVSMELNFTSCTGAAHYLYMRVNGNNVAQRVGSNYGGYGYIMRVLDLKKDDKITINTNYHYGTNQQCSCFVIEKL